MGAGGPRRGAGPPDGGWGWAVLGACFVITGFAYGFPKAVSVFFRALMRDFGAGYSDTAWVSSIMLAMLYGTGQRPLAGPSPNPGPRIESRDQGLGDTDPVSLPQTPRGRAREPLSSREHWHQREGTKGQERNSGSRKSPHTWQAWPAGRTSPVLPKDLRPPMLQVGKSV